MIRTRVLKQCTSPRASRGPSRNLTVMSHSASKDSFAVGPVVRPTANAPRHVTRGLIALVARPVVPSADARLNRRADGLLRVALEDVVVPNVVVAKPSHPLNVALVLRVEVIQHSDV